MQNCLSLAPGRTWPGRASSLPWAGSAGGERTKERVLAAKWERAQPIETISLHSVILLMTFPRLREGESLAQGHAAGQFAPSPWSFLVCAFGEDKLPTSTSTLDLPVCLIFSAQTFSGGACYWWSPHLCQQKVLFIRSPTPTVGSLPHTPPPTVREPRALISLR